MRRRMTLVVLVMSIVAAACGDDDGVETTATAAPAETTTTTAAPAETTTTAAPAESTTTAASVAVFTGDDGVESTITSAERIVSLSGDFTEILFELGAGDRIAAVDVTTTFPDAAADLPVIGFGQDLAPEPVLGMQPDLVLANELVGPIETIEQLRSAGVPVVVLNSGTSLEAPINKIQAIAELTGLQSEGQELAERVQGEIQAALDLAAQAPSEPRVAFVYTRGPQLLLLFGQGTATSAMITAGGGIDVGAEAGVFGAQTLTPEAIVGAAPDVIVLPSAGFGALGGAEAFLAIPGIAETPAGASEAFLAYDEAYFFNLGPRAGQALMEFISDLYPDLTG